MLPIGFAAAAGVGIALFARAALHFSPAGDALAFAGNLIGPGAGGLLGYWLVAEQERRADARKIGQVRALFQLIDSSITGLVDSGRGNNSGPRAQVAMRKLRSDVAIVRRIVDNYGVIDVDTLSALNDLAAAIDCINWGSIYVLDPAA